MFASVLPARAQATLAVLGDKQPLPAKTYLAGGSALALHYGHRRSIDFDFFTPTEFDPKKLSAALSAIGVFAEEVAKGISLIGKFNSTKLSCFRYDYPLIEETTDYHHIPVVHPHDIAAMKLVAICDRGTRKDFVDLYTLAKHGISLEAMMELYGRKYGLLESNMYTLIKALGYLDEADEDDMPEMLIPLSWNEVKNFFASESMRLAKKYLEGTASSS